MDYYVDASALVYPAINFADVAPYEPKRREHITPPARTEFGISENSSIDFFAAQKGPLAPTPAPRVQNKSTLGTVTSLNDSSSSGPVVAPIASPAADDIDQIAKQRVRLMAVKYATGAESSEVTARLEILNRRLIEKSPRITKEQVTALETAHDQLIRIRAAREQRSKRLGIQI